MKTHYSQFQSVRLICFLFFVFSFQILLAQPGKDGALTISTLNTIVNCYSPIASNASAGSFTVNTNALCPLTCGDLVMIYQAQGATINTTNTSSYGSITSLNSAGLYEFQYVVQANAGIVTLQNALTHSYTTAGKAQLIKVPQYSSLTVNAGASIIAAPWNDVAGGRTGGVLVVHCTGAVTNNGLISSNAKGFRAGIIEQSTSGVGGNSMSDFVSTNASVSAEKGESIAGFNVEYDLIGGRFGRGAPANGGGGGNGHNCGGGGGSNGNNGNLYNGNGNMCTTCPGVAAWNLDPFVISNGGVLASSSGGGRGGYSYGASNGDAIIHPPAAVNWNGDYRDPFGGLGGTVLTNLPETRVFLGGGGGAGDTNNSGNLPPGPGGGLVFIIAPNIVGGGTISANGGDALNQIANSTGGANDAPGGGGGGGSIILKGNVAGTLSVFANGGKGGDQGFLSNESEGPGGGGGGGFVAITSGTPSISIAGGQNGITLSGSLTEFIQNGATSGAEGNIAVTTNSFINYINPINLTSSVNTPVCLGSTLNFTTNVNIPGGTYTWSGPSAFSSILSNPTRANAQIAHSGSYQVIYTSLGGCKDTSVSITLVNPVPIIALNPQNLLCNGVCNGAVNLNFTTQTTPSYSYLWNNGAVSQNISSLCAGNFNVVVTDQNGCSAVGNSIITSPTVLSSTFTQTNVTCNNVCNGSITVTPIGGTPGYQFSLNGGSFQASTIFSGLCAGVYTVVVKDLNNCNQTLNVTIAQPTQLTLNISSVTNATCGVSNGSVSLNANGGTLGYLFNNGGANQASNIFSGLAPGNYTFNVIDANGCLQTINQTILASPIPIISLASQQNVSCNGGTNGQILVSASAGISPLQYQLNAGVFQTSNLFSNLPAGSYTITVKDANNCIASVPVNITQPAPLTFTHVVSAISCFAVCDGTITITGAGGSLPFTYSANAGLTFQASNVLNNLCAGTFEVVIKDNNGCLTNATIPITQPTVLNATASNVAPTCFNGCDGSVTFVGSGGTSAYEYSIDAGLFQSSNMITNVCNGFHTLTIRDANNCLFNFNTILTNPPQTLIAQPSMTESNCGANNGAMEITASGTVGPYEFSLNGGPFDPNGIFTNMFAGAYQVVVQNGLGCLDTTFVAINDIEMDGILIDQGNPLCFNGTDGFISVTNVNGAAPITFLFDTNPTGFGVGNFTDLSAGPHIVTILDGGNCIFAIPITLTEPAPLVLTLNANNVVCNGGSSGSIQVDTAFGGTGTYQYSIDNGASFGGSSVFNSLSTGTYPIIIQDVNNCQSTTSINISEPSLIDITLNNSNLDCFQDNSGVILAGATGGNGIYTYSIDGVIYDPNPIFDNLAAGAYTINVQDQTNCVISENTLISEPPVVSVNAVAIPTLCAGSCDGQVNATSSGGVGTYVYSIDATNIFQLNDDFINQCAGLHTVFVVDQNQCSDSVLVTVLEPTGLSLGAILTESTCGNSNGEIAVNLLGGAGGYQFSLNNGGLQASGNFTGLLAANYTILAEDMNGCFIDTLFSITDQESPVLNGILNTPTSCFGSCDGEIVANASGGTGLLSFATFGAFGSTSVFSGLCAGAYTVYVRDENNCLDSLPFTITEPTQLSGNATATNLTCNSNLSGEIGFNANGGTINYFYSIDNGNTFGSNPQFSLLPSGTYDLVIKDGNDCEISFSTTITEPDPLEADLILQDPSCNGLCDGIANTLTTGGTVNYTFEWDNQPGLSSINTLCAGNHLLKITDANNCVYSENFVIADPALFLIDSFQVLNTLCNGSCDGQVQLFANSGVSFDLSNGPQSAISNFTGLCAGSYTLNAYNANGCLSSVVATISEPLPIQLFSTTDSIMCMGDTVPLFAFAVGGTPNYIYSWNNGFIGQTQNVIQSIPQIFTVTVVDANGCTTGASSTNLTMLPMLTLDADNLIQICPTNSVNLSVDVINGAQPYSFLWNTSIADTLDNITVSPNSNTNYTVTVSDVCMQVDTTLSVEIFNVLTPVFEIDDQSGCVPFTFTFETNASSSLTNCTWTTSDGQLFNTCGPITTTLINQGCVDFTLNAETLDGCPVNVSFIEAVCAYGLPVANFNNNPQAPTELENTINFMNASNGESSYLWNFGNGQTSTEENPIINFNGIEAEESINACLIVTSEFGCVDTICKQITFGTDLLVWVPNSFTPDGDEFNNQFKPVFSNPELIQNYELLIFDRWGEIIFESKNPAVGWDGFYQNKMVKDGTYVWVVKFYSGNTKQKRFEGHVNVLK